MKGSFVDIDERARVEVAHPEPSPHGPGKPIITITHSCELDEPAWRRLVQEVDAMIQKAKS
jgi:hypothetical protein